MIKAVVRYDKNHFSALEKQFKNYKRYAINVFMVFNLLILLYLMIVTLVNFNNVSTRNKIFIPFWFFLGVYIDIKYFYALYSQHRKTANLQPVKELRHFTFTDDEFIMVIESDTEHSERRFKYEGLHKATEDNNYFFIYLNANQICIIGKNELTEGTPHELKTLLTDKKLLA